MSRRLVKLFVGAFTASCIVSASVVGAVEAHAATNYRQPSDSTKTTYCWAHQEGSQFTVVGVRGGVVAVKTGFKVPASAYRVLPSQPPEAWDEDSEFSVLNTRVRVLGANKQVMVNGFACERG